MDLDCDRTVTCFRLFCSQEKKYSALAPLLNDSLFAVRSEAARVLTEVPAGLFNQKDIDDFKAALDEYKERQASIADRPESHLNLGILYENIGENNKAEASYRNSIRIVNDFIPARFNLANFYNRTGRNSEAEQEFRDIIELEPENGNAYYSLGLLMAEINKLDEAAELLQKAVKLIPDRARVRYNYSLVLSHLGRSSDALSEMLKAHDSDSSDPGIVQAIAIFYIQEKQLDKARIYAEKLVELMPGAPGPEKMLNDLQQAIDKK